MIENALYIIRAAAEPDQNDSDANLRVWWELLRMVSGGLAPRRFTVGGVSGSITHIREDLTHGEKIGVEIQGQHYDLRYDRGLNRCFVFSFRHRTVTNVPEQKTAKALLQAAVGVCVENYRHNQVKAAAENFVQLYDHDFVHELEQATDDVNKPTYHPVGTPDVNYVCLQSCENDNSTDDTAEIFFDVFTEAGHYNNELVDAYDYVKVTFNLAQRSLHFKSGEIDRKCLDKTAPWPMNLTRADAETAKTLVHIVDDLCRKNGIYQRAAEAMQADINKINARQAAHTRGAR